VLSAMIRKLSAGVTAMLFMLYSALMGLTLFSIFIVYTAASIASTFFVTAGGFGAMSRYSCPPKHEFSGFCNPSVSSVLGLVLSPVVAF
ncbi:Bax inhibitor-1 family protein, partial [Escherichia coli]|uniref:Bax inhibitor-1 family protein n=1 Tax=Escherichia coli TaxID=562 RepID=UPI003F9F0ABF